MRVTATWAHSHLGLGKTMTQRLPGEVESDTRRSFGMWAGNGVMTYALKDVKEAARKTWVAGRPGRGQQRRCTRACAVVTPTDAEQAACW